MTDPTRPGLPARALLRLLRVYQGYSALRGPSCRFLPSCSTYAAEAIAAHGAVRGGRLALWRVLRCQPMSTGGWDPVPDAHPRHRTDPRVPSSPSTAGAGPRPAASGARPCSR